MTLKTKKWFYFNLIFITGGLAGYLIGTMIQTEFSDGMTFTSIGLLLTTIASFIQWKYIFNKLKNDKENE